MTFKHVIGALSRNEMSNYLEPDKIWARFRIKSESDFIDKVVLPGIFHANVPEVIGNEYKIVERLLFYSYFHYPLIDEALSKSTRIFESAVTLRLEQLCMQREGFESLNSKIKRLQNYCSKDLFDQWQAARELRNSFAHRAAGSFGGILFLNTFKHNLNLINTLFLETSILKNKENHLKQLLTQTEQFALGKFTLTINGQKILIQGARPYCSGILKKSGQSLWVFIPISGTKTITTVNDFPQSFILRLKEVQINLDRMEGLDVDKGYKLILQKTDHESDSAQFDHHFEVMQRLEKQPENLAMIYMALLMHTVNKEVANFVYEEW